MAKKPAAKTAARKAAPRRKPLKPDADGVIRLSGGNPQIAKGYGEETIQAYIAAMPGWTRAIGARMDALITRALPKVAKAVKWNTPLYGFGDETWFLGFHVYAKYIKVSFFHGEKMQPVPPEPSKVKNVRYLHVREGEFDEAQFTAWVKQASKLPGEKM